MKVMLIESKDTCIDVIMAILDNPGMRVLPCRTVEEAEKQVEQFDPDVVLLDSELLGPANHFLRNVPISIFTSKEYMIKAEGWIGQTKDEILANAVASAAGRKNALSKIIRIQERMLARTEAMEAMIKHDPVMVG